MVLKYWWMIIAYALVAAVLVGFALWRKKRQKQLSKKHDTKTSVHVAYSKRLQALESYKKVITRYKILVAILTVGLVGGLFSGVILSARPVYQQVEQPDLHNRDIVLCLDVSGSMTSTDKMLVEIFSDLADGFEGERIAMVVFDSSSSTVFPLTDDYTFIKQELSDAAAEFESWSSGSDSIYSGTFEGEGSSLIGDGLASCVMQFDSLDVERSRSIILATDNYTNGAQIVDLKQAGAYAKDQGVRVYGVNPADYSTDYSTDEVATEFREVVMATDGGYYKIDFDDRDNRSAVEGIVEKVSEQEATRFKGSPQLIENDIPTAGVIVVAVSLMIICAVAWRLKL